MVWSELCRFDAFNNQHNARALSCRQPAAKFSALHFGGRTIPPTYVALGPTYCVPSFPALKHTWCTFCTNLACLDNTGFRKTKPCEKRQGNTNLVCGSEPLNSVMIFLEPF